jgi:NTP pyrophosphatase (non-canonical NTP hydrolase)
MRFAEFQSRLTTLMEGIEHPRIATALALVEECGEVARCVLDQECYGGDTRLALAEEVGDVLVALTEVCERHGLSLDASAQAALTKIAEKAPGWRAQLGERLAALRRRLDGEDPARSG